jgi:carboxyl-terminal processing protease
MRLPIEDPSYRYTFDKIDALPEKCHRKPDPGPISVLDAVDNIFTVHYAFFQTRHIDWPALVSASRRRVTADISDKQLFQIVKELLASINDAHVSLTAKIGGKTFTYEAGEGRTLGALAAQARREGLDLEDMRERWETDYWTRDIGETLLGGAGHEVAGGNIKFGLIDNDIGFLSIRSMDDFADDEHKGEFSALDTAMDGAMALFKAAKAVIVDISLNDGGYDTLGRHIAGRFASERTLGYYKKAGDASGDRPQAIYIEPSERARYTGPVYLITSNFTLSAAEVFTICMRALANVTHVGEATRGALSDELTKPLPNGWSLTLSNEVYQDADGMAWEGSGIPPKVPIEVFSRGDVTVGHVRAVRAVIDMVRSR